MALYRFEAKVIGRAGGRSTVNAAAYRSGKTATSAAAYRHSETLTDERTGQTFDYSRKRGVAGSEILAPDNAPAWARDRQQLWNEVERVEKRKDAQLARDFVISLPHELDQEQRRALLTDFLGRHFVEDGYICDIAYHRPHGKGDDRNQHAHVMVPMRRIDEHGFAAKKDRPEGNPVNAWQTELAQLRKDWADTTNRHLEAAGRTERVSHLSLAEQGIDRKPEPKQGAIATKMEREGRESHAGNDRRRAQAENAARQAVAAEMENVISLTLEIIRRRNMDDLTPRQIDELAQRELEKLAEMDNQAKRMEAYRREREAEIEDARKREKDNRDREDAQARAGDIADAGTRYSIALGNAGGVNVYHTLANAALAECAAMKKQQEELRREAAAEPDREKRDIIDLRRRIEACEYNALVSTRLAGLSSQLTGRDDHPSAELDRETAKAAQRMATQLREERTQKQTAIKQREQDDTKRKQESDKPRAAEQTRPSESAAPQSRRENTTTEQKDAGREIGDAKQAKLDRLAQTEKAYAAHTEGRSRQPGMGGRGR